MKHGQIWILISGLTVACMGGEVEDSGIIYPNPKANFRLGTAESDEDNVNQALLRQLDSITLTDCEGGTEVISYADELRSQDDSFVSLESDSLACVSKMEVAASDVDGLAALVVAIERNGQSVRLDCPAAQCFPMVFEGNLGLSELDEDDAGQPIGPAHELRMNILRSAFLPEDAPIDETFVAGNCEGSANCIQLENEVTKNGAIEQLDGDEGNETWTQVLSATP